MRVREAKREVVQVEESLKSQKTADRKAIKRRENIKDCHNVPRLKPSHVHRQND